MLIGISGYIGSGKDTVAKMIQYWLSRQAMSSWAEPCDLSSRAEYSHLCGWEVKKFAGKLKQIVSLLTGIPVGDLELESVKASQLPEEWSYWKVDHYTDGKKVGNSIGKFSTLKEAQASEAEWRKIYQWPNSLKSSISYNYSTVRWLLQTLGTDAMRDKVHPNIHVNALFADYKARVSARIVEVDFSNDTPPRPLTEPVYSEFPNWILSDLRFPNEAQAIKDRQGINIRVERPLVKPGVTNSGIHAIAGGIERMRHESETALDNYQFDYTIVNDDTVEVLLERVWEMLIHFNLIKP